MIVNKLNNSTFYDFASEIMGHDITLYKESLTVVKSEKGVKIKLYLGGEREDERKFFFQDIKCFYFNYASQDKEQDISYDWVNYVLNNADELTDDEKDELVDAYNNNIEEEIENYASQKRQNAISY